MKAMLLAAGRGERMRPLTDQLPKPLLAVGGHALIEYHLHALAQAGVSQAVINLSWQGQQLKDYLGNGRRYGLALEYSEEGEPALETGGGIHRALPRLGPGAFLVVNGDTWTDLDFAGLRLPEDSHAHLVLVPNPEHNAGGDYALGPDGRIRAVGERLTYSGIAVMDSRLFRGLDPGRFPLKPLLDRALAEGRLTGELHRGCWLDVGTPARLAALDEALRSGRLRHPALASQTG